MTDRSVLPEFAPPSPPGRRQYIAPAVFAVLIVVVLAAVVALAQRSGGSGAPPRPGAFVGPVDPRPFVVYSVQQVSGGNIIFGSGEGQPVRDVSIGPSTAVEVLRAEPFDGIQVGDWVTLIGVPNNVRTFALRGIVVISSPDADRYNGFALTAGGFLGHEVSRDRAERPAVGGLVTAIGASSLTLEAPEGRAPVTVNVDPENLPTVFRVHEGEVSDLVAGATVAFPAEGGRPAQGFEAILVSLP